MLRRPKRKRWRKQTQIRLQSRAQSTRHGCESITHCVFLGRVLITEALQLAAEKEAAEEAARRKKMAEDDAARLEIERLAALKADAEAKAVNDAADAEKKLAADAAAAAQSKAEAVRAPDA
jgi:hypothetical protein